MAKIDLEFILFMSLGTLTGYVGLTAALFIAYIANYKKYWKMIVGFLIGWLIYAIFIGPGLTYTGNLVYAFIIGIIAIGMAYTIKEDKLKNNPKNA
jgi:glucan phosphoethanolaminetransferase (alkaline phosphatase superfamily)